MDEARLKGSGMTSQRARDRLVERLRASGILSRAVLEAIRVTPRHLFVDEALASRAYDDTALPIGYRQTISQPYVVALMSQAVVAGSPTRVLEIGTGSGYQTAVLAALVARVYSVERIGALWRRARVRCDQLGLWNVRLRHGDGAEGWADRAPFDSILVTAAADRVPQELLEQLSVGGQLIVPLVVADGRQRLVRVTRSPSGYQQEALDHVSFVPMRRGATG